MQFFENFDSNCFLFNGRKYVKNFVVLPIGTDAIAVYNAFDTRMQLLPATHFSQVKINSASMPSQAVLMAALVPMIFAKQIVSEGELKDEIISVGEITQNANEITIPSLAVWRIGGITHSNQDAFVAAIAAASTGETRVDIIVAKADSTLELISGEASDDVAVAPVVPNNTLLVTSITVLGQYVILGGDTSIGNAYIRKDDYNETFIGAYADYPELPLDAKRSVLRFIGGCSELGSLSFTNLPALYNGKRLIIKNFQSIPLTIKHNGGTGLYKFYFPNEEDFVVEPKQIIDFIYSATLKKFEFIGSISNGVDAPEDGFFYGRRDGQWAIPNLTDINLDVLPAEAGIIIQDSATGISSIMASGAFLVSGEYQNFDPVALSGGGESLTILPNQINFVNDEIYIPGQGNPVTMLRADYSRKALQTFQFPFKNGDAYGTGSTYTLATTDDLVGVSGVGITGATYNSTSKALTLSRTDGSSLVASGWTDNNNYITGGTFSTSAKTLTFTSNSGSTITVTGVTEVRQTILSGATNTSPSEAAVYTALDKKANKKSFIAAATGNTLATGTALRPIFTNPTNGALAVEANSLYSFECVFAATGASGSNIVQFGIGGTATLTNVGYSAILTRGSTYGSAISQYSTFSNVPTATNLNSSSTGGANHAIIRGTFVTGSAGTIIPSIGFTISASVVIEAGSIFSMERLGDNIILYSSDAS